MQILFKFIIFSILLNKKLVLKAIGDGKQLVTSNKLMEILEEVKKTTKVDRNDELNDYYDQIAVLTKNRVYRIPVYNFIATLNNKFENLYDENDKKEEVLEYFICCVKSLVRLLNYPKTITYNTIDIGIVSLFEKINSINTKYFSLSHMLFTYDFILLGEMKVFDLIKNNPGKEEEIFDKMDVLFDYESMLNDFQFLMISVSRQCALLRKSFEGTMKNNVVLSSPFNIYFDEVSFFISTKVLDYLKNHKKLQVEGINIKNAFLMLCNQYNTKEEYEGIFEQNRDLEDIRKDLNIILKSIEKEKKASENQNDDLMKQFEDKEDKYLLKKGLYNDHKLSNDMQYLRFKFEDLNEKFFDMFIYWEDIYKTIVKFYPREAFDKFSDILEEKLVLG